MSGNRMKLKNGLFIGALLSVTFSGYALEKDRIEATHVLTDKLDTWIHKLSDAKDPLEVLLKELQAIISNVHSLVQTLPDTPPADALLKTILTDLHCGLCLTHKTFAEAKSLRDFNGPAASGSLKPMLEKTQKDLNILISHVEAHNDLYEADVLSTLKKYRATSFSKLYNYGTSLDKNALYNIVSKFFSYFGRK